MSSKVTFSFMVIKQDKKTSYKYAFLINKQSTYIVNGLQRFDSRCWAAAGSKVSIEAFF